MSKNITIEDVKYTAGLALLSLSDEDLSKMTDDLNDVLGNFADLQKADTIGVEVLNHYDLISPRKNHFREDVLQSVDGDAKEIIKDNFPSRQDDLLAVKSVLSR
jgi:aspartyl/glutamyl-tRNA(Asn/Gln) amidotransferase C subunit